MTYQAVINGWEYFFYFAIRCILNNDDTLK